MLRLPNSYHRPAADPWFSGHTYYRFNVAVIDPNGHAAYTAFATMISEAWRLAEGNVYWRDLKRDA